MKNSPRNKDDSQSLPPSPSSRFMTITKITTPRPNITRSESTTVCYTPSSYRQIVRMLTGPPMYPNPTHQPGPLPRYALPPLIPVHKKNKSSSSSSSSSTIYQRRNSKKHLKINPVRSGSTERLSPSILNLQSLVLSSPDSPLVHDPFFSGSDTPIPNASESGEYEPKHDSDVDEREIREKGFYLLPSPSSPMDPKPQLLHLFPLTSPRASESPASSS